MPEFLSRFAGGGLVCLALTGAPGARAQQLEPRTYVNLPVGMNFLIAGLVYTEGGLSTDPALPLTNAQLKLKTPILAYARSFEALGQSAKFDVVLPAGCVSGSAISNGALLTRDVCGALDPAFRIAWNFHGAPAMSLEEFRHYRQDLIAGASLQVQVPLGQYDPSRLVNLSTNRWTFRPEVGVSKAFPGLTVELALGASLFTTNDNFFGGKTREQDPVYSAQVHLIHEFRGGMWAAVNGTYYRGGRTRVNGVEGNDELSNSRAGLTLAFPVNRQDSIKLYASTGVSVRTGEDFNVYGIAWQHRWGGGV